MKNSKSIGSPISQNDRFVNPFSEKSFEAVIVQNLSDVKYFLKYFSESPEAQTEENVKTFYKIFFYGAELRSKVAKLKAELDAQEYRTFVYPRTIKGASTTEFIKTKREYNKYRAEIEAIDRFGKNITIIADGDSHFTVRVKVKAEHPEPFFGWLFQFGTMAEIIEPCELRDRYIEMLKSVTEKQISVSTLTKK